MVVTLKEGLVPKVLPYTLASHAMLQFRAFPTHHYGRTSRPMIHADKIHDDGDHWLWTGYITPGREITRLRPPLKDSAKPRGPYKATMTEDGSYPTHYKTQRLPEPRVRHKHRSIPARRVVMADYLNLPVEEVPTLKQICRHAHCVRPQHHLCKSGSKWVSPDAYTGAKTEPLTLGELLASDASPFQSIESILADFPGRTLDVETYRAFQQSEA